MPAVAVLLAATAAATWWLSRSKPIDSIGGLVRLTSDSGLTWEPALFVGDLRQGHALGSLHERDDLGLLAILRYDITQEFSKIRL
jgi:hypothetical protein